MPLSEPKSMSEIADRIKSAGYWRVVIHPTVANLLDLYPILQRCQVQARGWYFPHLDRRKDPVPHLDFIQQEGEWDHHAERWRFYQSGQFDLLRAMSYDWRDRSGLRPPDKNWKRGAELGISECLLTYYEAFELSARLSSTKAGDDPMRISVEVGGLKGRALVVDDPRRGEFDDEDVAQIDSVPLAWTITRAELLARTQELTISAATELFARFGRQLSGDLLGDWLKQIIRF
jgi:hypothetical protein